MGVLFIMRIKRGTIREDGKILSGYYKKNNIFKEYWITKEQYDKSVIRERNRSRDRYKKNSKANLDSCKKWYEKNKEAKLQKCKKYRLENKDVYRKYMRNKRENNNLFRCSSGIRSLIIGCMRNGGFQKKTKTQQILGCSFEEFKSHLESQFKFGMSWENRNLWHIDHIMPVSMAKTYDEVVRLNHYNNLRPMWAHENQSKGSKTPDMLVLF